MWLQRAIRAKSYPCHGISGLLHADPPLPHERIGIPQGISRPLGSAPSGAPQRHPPADMPALGGRVRARPGRGGRPLKHPQGLPPSSIPVDRQIENCCAEVDLQERLWGSPAGHQTPHRGRAWVFSRVAFTSRSTTHPQAVDSSNGCAWAHSCGGALSALRAASPTGQGSTRPS